MSYSLLKRKPQEFEHIFHNSKIHVIKPIKNIKLNLILSSEAFVSKLQPILEGILQDSVDDKKVILIPNAGVGEDKMQMSYQHLEEFTTINNMYLKLLDIERWPKEIIVDALNSCDVIALSGGLVSRLIQAIDDCDIRNELITMIKKGKPVIGFSAGAMSLASSTIFAQKFIGEEDSNASQINPLGVIDFEIYPHFSDDIHDKVKAIAKSIKESYALKNNEALVITNGELIAIGDPLQL